MRQVSYALLLNIDNDKKLEFKDIKDKPLEDQLGHVIHTMLVEGNKRYAQDLVKRRAADSRRHFIT